MRNWLVRGFAAAMLAFGLAATPAAAQFSDGYNFLKAVRDKDVTKAKGFIDKPGSTLINARDLDSGDTALLIVTKRRDAPWMAFLLQNGADTAARDRNGDTALTISAGSGYSDGVRVMLSRKPQVDAANNRGETALIRAVHAKDPASVQLLLNAGADPDRTDNLAGMSARDYAARDVRGGELAKLLAEAPKKSAKKVTGPSL